MKLRMILVLVLLIILFMMISTTGHAKDTKAFSIPRVQGITVDGSSDDWAEQGFRVEFLTDPSGRALPAEDFDVKFRLGWSPEGLLVLAAVRDDIPFEHENLSRLWRRDCVEIFIAEKVGHENRYQLVVTSGADPQYRTVRSKLYDWRPENERDPKLTTQSASRVFEGGYVVEVLLPWENLGMEPSPGMELGFQFVANDEDGEAEDSSGSLRVAWFPGLGPSDPNNFYRVKLSDEPSEPVLFRVERKISLGECTVSVRGSSDLIGEAVAVRSADEVFARSKLDLKDGRAGFQLPLKIQENTDVWPQLEVTVGDKPGATFEAMPTLDRVLEKYTEAIGGREAIEKLTTRMCTGQYSLDLSWRKPPKEVFPFEAYAKIPDKWLMTLQISNRTEQNGFDGKVGWKQDADRIEHDNKLGRSKLAWILNPQGALQIPDYFQGMILKAKETLRGRTVFVVEPTLLDKAHYMLYFDIDTGLLSQIGYYWELKDYREVDGVKFPFRIVMSRKGGSSTFAFDKVKHNVPVDDTRFSMPDPGVVFADAFQGIEDTKVLPMLKLKDLTYEHGEMNIPIRDGRFLYDLIVQNGYKRGLEIGTYNGYSTLWMGLAFKKTGGKVITIEYEHESALEAKRNFRKAGLDDVIDTRINDAFKEIPQIEGEFDFVFIDANKEDYFKFLKLIKDRILPGGALVGHNVINYAPDLRDFLDAIKNDPELETSIHDTSAEGISLSIKRK